MSGVAPVSIVLPALQKTCLEAIVRRQTCPQALASRAELVLMMAECTYNSEVAKRLRTSRQRVWKWRKRWLAEQERLKIVEETGGEKELLSAIEEVLKDAPGRGAKPRFSAEQVCQIVAVACERPEDKSGRPIACWTHRELADEVMKRGIVESISPRQVGRFLKRSRHKTAQIGILAESAN